MICNECCTILLLIVMATVKCLNSGNFPLIISPLHKRNRSVVRFEIILSAIVNGYWITIKRGEASDVNKIIVRKITKHLFGGTEYMIEDDELKELISQGGGQNKA